MSRLKNFTHSLASGYMQTGVTALYSFASIPLALHYLSKDEFGLWQVAVTVAGYLLLIDFGMTTSSARILIDHKDKPHDGAYGSVIKISTAVFLLQGMIVALGGIVLGLCLPKFMNVQPQFERPLFYLVAGQCLLMGLFFVSRIFWNLGLAHQRYDLYNYSQIGVLTIQFPTLWLAFHEGFGIYSMLIAAAVGMLFGFCCGWIVALKFGFLPPRGCWGRFNQKLFKEIFFYGGDSFLLALGYQLTSASQVLIIGHTMGLGAAAVWSVATKPFMMAQQLVGRIFAFSCSALSEMLVRGEHDRFLKRFRDLAILTTAVAILVAGSIALCNESFLKVWLKGRITWNPLNDFLFALWFVLTSATGNHVTVVALTKQIGRMRYVCFFEGLIFVGAAILVAPRFGFSGIIVAATIANLACSGVFGMRRTIIYFQVPAREVLIGWMKGPLMYLVMFLLVLSGCHWLTRPLPTLPRLLVNAVLAGILGLWLLWRFGLNRDLRVEAGQAWSKILSRLRQRI